MAELTKLGEYFERKSVNKASVGRKTGLSKNRLTSVTTSETARLMVEELYLIALAIEVDPGELLEYVCEGLELKPEEPSAADN
ncbi:MAG: DNA-binding protein [Flavobacterium psychrophilum]|nr:MAG: DNA-binding protein [Flavobacterium psychrophilum]